MATGPIVMLEHQASLCGLYVYARNCAKPVCAFLGVPFAEPPERFAPPEPLRLWTGSKKAIELGAICPQNIKTLRSMYSPYPVPDLMSEDCLNLNVWTPTCDGSAQLPVMVWFYGGSYTSGCCNYFDGTAYAALHDVVFVSFNFRIGLLGFMSTGDDEVRGNMGLLDQREALRWIQKYIHVFGGDPNKVTLFGESAGANNICWHLLTPQSRGLFNRVILQSGTMCYNLSALTKDRCRRYFYRVIKALGIDVKTSVREAVRQLRAMPISDIVRKGPHRLFFATVDGLELIDDAFDMFSCGQFSKVDMLLGFNSDEGHMFVDDVLSLFPGPLTVLGAQEVLRFIVNRLFNNYPSTRAICDIIWSEYFKAVTDVDLLKQRLSQVYGDILFIVPTVILASIHSKFATGCKTFLYQFVHRPSFSRSPEWVGALHGNEIPFVIGEPFLDRLPDIWWEDERRLSASMMTMWSSFARSGDPNTIGEDIDFSWPQYRCTDRRYAIIATRPSVGVNYCRHRMDLHEFVIGSLANIDRLNDSKL